MSIVLSLTTKQTKALTDLLLAQPPTKEIVDIYAKIYKLSPSEQSNIGTALIGPSTELNPISEPSGSQSAVPIEYVVGLDDLRPGALDTLHGVLDDGLADTTNHDYAGQPRGEIQHSPDDSAGDGVAVDVHQHVDGWSTEDK